MAKNKSKSRKTSTVSKNEDTREEIPRITLEDLNAADSSDSDMPPEEDWDKDTKALFEAIKGGKFDHLIEKNEQAASDDDESIEEVELNSDAVESSEDEKAEESEDDEEQSADEEEIEEKAKMKKTIEPLVASDSSASEASESDDEESSENEATDEAPLKAKALHVVTRDLKSIHDSMPWPETFDVVPQTPLPFGLNNDGSNPLDIHDDLKREVAFYDLALEAAMEARKKCAAAKIPFSRPEDFFAEMVKTDDHMAKIKDRLIFETKKMDAVAQRKANREQKVRAKEKQANRLAEKARRKREHFEDLARMREESGGGINKKRQAADRKYGWGGKTGRFKQNSARDLNDPSGFDPRGQNFQGGRKRTLGGSGAQRMGKRARDARRR